MRSEALDIVIETRGSAVWLVLAGPFHNEQAPNIREKILGLALDGNLRIVIDLERVIELDSSVVPTFLQLLNQIRDKGGDLIFIFRNEAVTRAFAGYRNLFSIFPDTQSVNDGGLLGRLRRTGKLLFRRTGVRISRSVAIFLLVVLCGWFLSLLFIVYLQNQRIQQQSIELRELTQWRQKAALDLQTLRERIRPMEQLGLLPPDTTVN